MNVDEPQGGLVVPQHIAKDIFTNARRVDRERKMRRRRAWIKLAFWFGLFLFSLGELLPVADWRTLFALLVYGVATAGGYAIVRRLVGCLRSSGHVPSAKYVARWDDNLLHVDRKGKGIE